jgi:hypothetical protein
MESSTVKRPRTRRLALAERSAGLSNAEAVTKLFYLALNNISKKWTMLMYRETHQETPFLPANPLQRNVCAKAATAKQVLT